MTSPPDDSQQPMPPDDFPDDPVMLAILANGGRHGEALDPDQERLLDDWVAGRLAAENGSVAAALVRSNVLAAEYALERRLLAAMEQGPGVPPDLTARLRPLLAPAPPPPRRRGLPLAWRWPALVGGLVLGALIGLAALPLLQQSVERSTAVQVALLTLPDRTALFEPSDVRLRGGERIPSPASERRFGELEVPVSVLRGLLRDGPRPDPAAIRDIEALLPRGGRSEPTRILVDAALRARVEASPDGGRLAVRLYDLDDPRTTDLRAAIGATADPGRRLFLLTVKP